jgi:nucleoside-diphosphate-sugar epimerase
MLLITGAAGNSGCLIVKALSQQGQRLRALHLSSIAYN